MINLKRWFVVEYKEIKTGKDLTRTYIAKSEYDARVMFRYSFHTDEYSITDIKLEEVKNFWFIVLGEELETGMLFERWYFAASDLDAIKAFHKVYNRREFEVLKVTKDCLEF